MRAFGNIRSQRGGINAEYALAAAILIGVFVSGAAFMKERADRRMEAAEEVVKGFTPCVPEEFGGLLSVDDGECK